MLRRPWKSSELRYVRENYTTVKASEIAEWLNRSEGAVHQVAWRFGLRKNDGRATRDWTPKEDEEILKVFDRLTKALNRTPSSIYGRYYRLKKAANEQAAKENPNRTTPPTG